MALELEYLVGLESNFGLTLKLMTAPVLEIQFGKERNELERRKEIGSSAVASNSLEEHSHSTEG